MLQQINQKMTYTYKYDALKKAPLHIKVFYMKLFFFIVKYNTINIIRKDKKTSLKARKKDHFLNKKKFANNFRQRCYMTKTY